MGNGMGWDWMIEHLKLCINKDISLPFAIKRTQNSNGVLHFIIWRISISSQFANNKNFIVTIIQQRIRPGKIISQDMPSCTHNHNFH